MGSVLRHREVDLKTKETKISSFNVFNQSEVYYPVSPKFNTSIGEAKAVEGASDVAALIEVPRFTFDLLRFGL